ncbi:unnamed protein product [Rotaria magnacalcarata]|uniref:Uncharacterized protein n=2 Tax=Rotaria magnacalcarata TaxID=392030 RepID=A0A815M184_9BILA|nr:unnamed protein product [Rotaria magnacalcarata]
MNPCSFYLISAAYANIIWISVCPLIRMFSTFGLNLSESIVVLCKVRRSLSYKLSMISVALATIDQFLVSSTHFEYHHLSSLRSAHRLVAFATIACCIRFGDMLYCLNVTGTAPLETCTYTTRRMCGFYNEIVPIPVLIPCPLIINFGFTTIRNIHQSRKKKNVTKKSCQSIRRTDRPLIQVQFVLSFELPNTTNYYFLFCYIIFQMIISQSLLRLISYVPNMVRHTYTLSTFYVQRSSMRSKIETIFVNATFFLTTFQSSFSFFIDATSGEEIFD